MPELNVHQSDTKIGWGTTNAFKSETFRIGIIFSSIPGSVAAFRCTIIRYRYYAEVRNIYLHKSVRVKRAEAKEKVGALQTKKRQKRGNKRHQKFSWYASSPDQFYRQLMR